MPKMGWTSGAVALAASAVVLIGCGRTFQALPDATERASGFRTASVPHGFLWGVSTAGYQWEGQDHTSQWAAWDKAGRTEERNPRGANGLVQYAEDTKLSRNLGANAFRTSFEWGRIEPKEGVIDPAGVAFYHRLLDSMKANGLTPLMTLHHFSYPSWMDADGGWENPKSAERFERFAKFIAKEYGDKVDLYITFNEPNVYLAGGYLTGMMPPGRKSALAGLRAMKHMVEGHKRAYDAIHAGDARAQVSFNMYTAEWAVGVGNKASTEGKTATDRAREAITSDTEFMDQVMGINPDGSRAEWGPKVDFAAFDYYCKFKFTLPFVFPRPDTWEVYPQGFYKAIKRYYNRYKLPVLIAENGMATHNLEPRKDGWTRSAYTVAHIQQMQRAIAEGVPVMGYVHWSITDNYEWGTFSPRFGLYRVECRDKNYTRIPTDGVKALVDVIAYGGVTQPMLAKYLPGTIGGINLPVPNMGGGSSHGGVSGNW